MIICAAMSAAVVHKVGSFIIKIVGGYDKGPIYELFTLPYIATILGRN